MPNVILVLNWYLASCIVAGMVFFVRSWWKWWRVGLVHYPLMLIICSLGWPLFIRKGYF